MESILSGDYKSRFFITSEEQSSTQVGRSNGNEPPPMEKPKVEIPKIVQKPTELKATGSGFFVGDDGYLLTNWHVAEGAARLKIKTKGGGACEAHQKRRGA